MVNGDNAMKQDWSSCIRCTHHILWSIPSPEVSWTRQRPTLITSLGNEPSKRLSNSPGLSAVSSHPGSKFLLYLMCVAGWQEGHQAIFTRIAQSVTWKHQSHTLSQPMLLVTIKLNSNLTTVDKCIVSFSYKWQSVTNESSQSCRNKKENRSS